MEEIGDRILPKLLKELEDELPRSAMIYNVVRLKILQINNKKSKQTTNLFSYGEISDRLSDTLFLCAKITVKGVPQNFIVVFAPPIPTQETLLSLEELIDWNEINQFEGIEQTVVDYLKESGKKYGTVQLHDPIELYYMEKLKALSFTEEYGSGESLKVNQLIPENANKVNQNWPAACPGSLEMLIASIEEVGSAGVYINAPSDTEIFENDLNSRNKNNWTLASWTVALPFGSIHALHTEVAFQRRGFAGFVMKFISKLVAQAGRIPVVQIYKTNDSSKSLNQKIGFVYSHDINLLHYYPSSKMVH